MIKPSTPSQQISLIRWAKPHSPLPRSSQQLLFPKRKPPYKNKQFYHLLFSLLPVAHNDTFNRLHLQCTSSIRRERIWRNSLKCDVTVPVGWYDCCSAAAAAAVGGSRGYFTIFPERDEHKVRMFSAISWVCLLPSHSISREITLFHKW